MTTETLPDDVIARQVREAVEALNTVMLYAQQAGLSVTPGIVDCTRLADPAVRNVVTVRVFREL